MSLRLFGFVISLLVAILPMIVNGQKIRFYNSEQGLPNSLIHKVSQDAQGYIWIASENGVSYFDGMRFTTFRHDPKKSGTISSDLVKVVYTDSRGVCWVGTSNGLQIFDRENNVFRDFALQYPSFTGTFYVSSILESKDHEKLLVSVSGFGIAVYDESTHLIDLECTDKLKKIYGNSFLGSMFIDSDGFLWTYSEQGSFFRINFNAKTLDKLTWSDDLLEISKKIAVSAITEDPVTKNILIGTYNHGLFIYDRSLCLIRKPKGKSSSNYRIRALLAEKEKGNESDLNIWVGSEDSGLRKFDRNKEEIINSDFQYAPIDIDNCKVHSIIQDVQGNIWAGIFQKGLLIIPKTTNDFQYMKLSDSQGSMSANLACATSITRNNEGDLWVGTDGGGLFRISENGTKNLYTKENTPLPNNAVLTLSTDKRGTIWISSYMGGITSYNSRNGFQSYSNDIVVQKVMSALYDNKNDKLYLGTLGHGVNVISFSENKLEAFPHPDELKWISSLCLDNSGNLWIGLTEGVRCFKTENGEEIYSDLTSKIKGISIGTSLEDRDGSMWFGSSNGLYHLQKETNKLKLYSISDGLPSNSICAIQQDENDNLWISTYNGLSKFNPKTETFKNFYVYDGLQDNEFRMKAIFKDRDGRLFFGGINGITAFYPNRIQSEEKLLSKINFSQLTVLNKSVIFDETLGAKNILDRHISQARRITLRNNQNVFSLEFNVLEYANPHKIVYGYLLNGFDKEWQYTNSNHRMATYTNLPEGSYTFQIKAFFEGNTDKSNVVHNEINIRILPPWYKSWWAYFIYLTIFMFMVWESLNLLIRRKLRIQDRLESEKKELKLQMFTDLTHEIRTPFTLVMTPLKSMRDSETDHKKKEMFNLIYRNALRILRSLNQLMDIRKIDNQQFVLQYQKTDLIFFVQDIMKSFDQLAIMRNIDFRLVSNLESLEVWIDQVNFDKVLFNILSNAFKFTHDNGYIMISLDTFHNTPSTGLSQSNREYVELCIENSGSKIDIDDINQIFERFYQSRNNKMIGGSGIGLHLAKMIVQLHHGKIMARNSERGVAFIVQIPIGNKHLSADEILDHEKEITSNLVAYGEEELANETNYIELPQIEEETIVPKGSKTKRTLVFVDDDADFCKYIHLELSDKYHIEVYTDAKEAWKVISTTIPDVVVTDLLMPDIDGLTLCRRIRQNPETNHLPVIIITAQTNEESEQQCIENGADHFITKPINIELLKTTIVQVIQTRDTLRNKYLSNINSNFDQIKMVSHNSRLIAKAIEAIRKNIENPEFNVDDLSREVGLSRVHLNRKLKENLNISPNNLIKSIRLKQAAYLLINNKVNISDVAYKVGFSSHPYFSSNFKEYFGMAPSEFVSKYTESEEKETLSKLFEN